MELNAQKREKFGKANKSLRKEDRVPGVIFGNKMESLPISLSYIEVNKALDEAGETTLVDIKIDSNKYKVLFKDIQNNPVTGRISHVGFYKPDLTEKIRAQVPVEVINEEENELIKSGEAMILNIIDEITVEALPTDLPHEFTIDATQLKEIGDIITIEQLNYDKEKVEIVDVNPDDLVVKLDSAETQQEEEEEVSEEEALEKIEATEETAKEDEEETEEK